MTNPQPERTVPILLTPIRIKALTTIQEMENIVELEKQIWGYGTPGSDDPYPARAMFAMVESGGLVAGALLKEELVAFAVAWLGSETGTRRPYLHSQLLGVLPSHRSCGIGYHLKLFQRDYALANNLELVKWTYDPLLSANAYLNLHKLGAVIKKYVPNYYGNMQSCFTQGIASDRVWVSWYVKSFRVQERIKGSLSCDISKLRCVSLVEKEPVSGLERLVGFDIQINEPRFLFEIPCDFTPFRMQKPKLAREWQEKIRSLFLHHLNRCCFVSDFFFKDGRAFYLIDCASLDKILNPVT